MLRTTWRVVDQEEIPVVKNSSNIGFTVNPPRWLIYFKHVGGGGELIETVHGEIFHEFLVCLECHI